MALRKKNPAAVALGRKGGKKGGPARAARLTPKQRSESARKAVQARWSRAKQRDRAAATKDSNGSRETTSPATATAGEVGHSDQALLTLLKRIKATEDPKEVRQLSDELERVIFHKQFRNA